MKFKGKIMLVVGIMAILGLLGEGKFFKEFGEGNMIADITTLVIIGGLILGGIVLMIIGRNE